MGKFEKGNTIGNRFKANAEQTEIAKRGGIASGEARRRVKSLKEALNAWKRRTLEGPTPSPGTRWNRQQSARGT